MTTEELYSLYAQLCELLAELECESCGGSAQHVEPDGSVWCFECVAEDKFRPPGVVVYPGMD